MKHGHSRAQPDVQEVLYRTSLKIEGCPGTYVLRRTIAFPKKDFQEKTAQLKMNGAVIEMAPFPVEFPRLQGFSSICHTPIWMPTTGVIHVYTVQPFPVTSIEELLECYSDWEITLILPKVEKGNMAFSLRSFSSYAMAKEAVEAVLIGRLGLHGRNIRINTEPRWGRRKDLMARIRESTCLLVTVEAWSEGCKESPLIENRPNNDVGFAMGIMSREGRLIATWACVHFAYPYTRTSLVREMFSLLQAKLGMPTPKGFRLYDTNPEFM